MGALLVHTRWLAEMREPLLVRMPDEQRLGPRQLQHLVHGRREIAARVAAPNT